MIITIIQIIFILHEVYLISFIVATFSHHDLEYLKLILDMIMENPMRQINSTRALNIAKEMNKNNKRFTVQDAEKTLQKFTTSCIIIDYQRVL